jgi:hypothetical protein
MPAGQAKLRTRAATSSDLTDQIDACLSVARYFRYLSAFKLLVLNITVSDSWCHPSHYILCPFAFTMSNPFFKDAISDIVST